MRSNIYDVRVFYVHCSRRHVSAGIPAIFRVMLLQEHNRTHMFDCVTIKP